MILDNAITSAGLKTLAEIRQPAINNEKTFPELVEVRARELVEQYGLGRCDGGDVGSSGRY